MYKKRTPFIFPFTDGLGVERFRVEFICESAAEAVAVSQRGASAPCAAAFLPAEPPVVDDATPDAEIVAAAKLGSPGLCALFLDRLAEQEDDLGAPGEPPRCRAMGSCD